MRFRRLSGPATLLLSALAAGHASGAEPAGTAPVPQHSAQAEISVQTGPDGIRRLTTVNQRFDLSRLRTTGADILVQQTLTRHERTDLDDADVRLESTAWMDGDRPLTRKVWTVTDPADEGRFWGGLFYVTRLEPRGPGEYFDRYYDLATGRFLFPASDEIVELDPKVYRRARWVAYCAAYAMDDPGRVESDLGWLSILFEDGTVRSYRISAADRGVSRYNPDWGLVDPRDGSVAKRLRPVIHETLAPPLELRLRFDSDEPQVRLPLGDGGLDLDHARLAPGFRVVPGEPYLTGR